MDTGKDSESGKHQIPTFERVMYIHAGLPKQFLGINREALKDQGVLYPTTGIHGTGHVKFAISFLREEYLRRMRKSNLLCDSENARKIKHHLEDEISASSTNIESVIISAESFDGTDKEGLKRLIQLYQPDFQIKVIIYLRRQDKFAESLHAQAYRVREVTFDRNRLLAKGFFRYDRFINLWSNVLGRENLILREFPESAPDDKLIQDFLAAVEVENFSVHTEKMRLNTRLDRLALEYIHHHTQLQYGSKQYFRVVQLLCKFSQFHPVEEKFRYFFSPGEQQLILDNCSETNSYLSEKYFNGSLFKDVSNPSLMTEWEQFTGLSATQIELMDSYLLQHGIDGRMIGRQ